MVSIKGSKQYVLALGLLSSIITCHAGTMGPVEAPAIWSGPYVGLNAGGFSPSSHGSWRVPGYSDLSVGGFTTVIETNSNNGGGNSGWDFTGGAQAGLNYQAGRFVYGLEGDFNYAHFETNRTVVSIPAPLASLLTINQHASQDWLSTVRGRFGIASNSLMVYGTGGLAIAQLHYSDRAAFVNLNSFVNQQSSNRTETGWTAGGGLEFRFATNWSAKVEYLYVDLGHRQYSSVSVDSLGPLAQSIIDHDHNLTENVVRLGINYQFQPA